MMLLPLIGAFAVVSVGGQDRKPCRNNTEQVGSCFQLHGRISSYDGVPSFRIWKIGTDRMLGISASHRSVSQMPADLENELSSDSAIEAFGDFEVCPFTKERQGELQLVCAASASNVGRARENSL
jgi:hypothetical protein